MTVELLSIDYINEQYLHYDGQRGCKNWLKTKGLLIIKLGKKYFVKADQFKEVLNKISNGGKTIQAVKNKSIKNTLADYDDIYNDLLRNINEL